MILHKIFEHARSAPQKLAIAYLGYRVSYGEFAYWIADAREFFAAQDLRAGGIAVLLAVPHRLDAWTLDFALRSLGMNTVAVASPTDLRALDLRDVCCVVTSIHEDPIPHLPAGSYKLFRIPQPLYLGKTAGTLPDRLDLAHPEGGHILLTSGTTGVRKMVLIGADFLAAMSARRGAVYGINHQSMVDILDLALWTGAGYKLPLSTWLAGGTVIFHHNENFHHSLLIDGITHAVVTPPKLSEILKAPDRELRFNPRLLLSVGGAPLSHQLAEAARTRLTPNVYTCLASTEVGIWGLTRIEGQDDLCAHQIHPSVEVQVVDESDRPLAAGEMGAIRIRARDCVSGYFEDAAATGQMFRDGYFYSGDIGEFRPDGRLVLHGRASSVIIVRGTKLAAEPIERKLQERLQVRSACVLSLPGNGSEDDVHLVLESNPTLPKSELAAVIGKELSGFPPVGVHFLQEMPRNDMGKIDRIILRQRVLTMPVSLIV